MRRRLAVDGAAVGAGLLAAWLMFGGVVEVTETGHAPSVEVPGRARLVAMTASGECWSNDGKPHPIPSRAWVAVPWSGSGDVRYVLRGRATVEAGLNGRRAVARYCR